MGIESILKLILSAVLGGMTGIEREFSHAETGLKINALTAFGSTLMTIPVVEFAGNSQKVPIMIGIIVAVGMISAGIVIREKFTNRGLSTAVFVWSSGALGISVGMGYYITAFIAAILILALDYLLGKISLVIEKQRKTCVYVINTTDSASVIVEIKKIMMDIGLKFVPPNVRKKKGGFEIEMTLNTSQAKNKAFVDQIMQVPDVKEISVENL